MRTRHHRAIATLLLLLLTLLVTSSVMAQRAAAILVVNTGALNVRSGPGPQYSVITVVRGGTELPVLGSNSDGTWYLVASSAGNGWVDVSFTLARGDFTFVPVINPSPVTTTTITVTSLALPNTVSTNVPAATLDRGQVIVNTGALNVRTGPGTQFSTLGAVRGGTVLTPAGVTDDALWFLVDSPFGRGWVSVQFTLFRGTFENLPIVVS